MTSTEENIIQELMSEFNLTRDEVIEIKNSPFKFIREKIKSIKLNGCETKEEFDKKTYNFNIPSIGKLHANYSNFVRINKYKKNNKNGS